MKFGPPPAQTFAFLVLLIAFRTMPALAEGPIVITQDTKRAVPFAMSGYTGVAREVLTFDFEVAGFKFVAPEKALYTLAGMNNGQLEGRLYDSSKTLRLGRAYASGDLRARAHALADDVILAITGQRGICGGKIAFRIEEGPNSEVAIADYDGYNEQKVTHDNSMIQGPGWAPGAFKLVYTSYRSSYPAIYLQDLATGERKTIAEYPGGNFSPAVSPDGRKVAMILSKTGQVDLYVANIDGSDLRELTHSREDESSPCWSPDSRTICFGGRDFGGRATLFAISAEGGEPRRITTVNALNTTEPDWSPDGRWIAFTSLQGGFNICVVPAEGGEAKLLVEGQDPSWAPNSRTLIFTRNDRKHLSLLDVPTKTVKDVHQLSGNWSQPAWSK